MKQWQFLKMTIPCYGKVIGIKEDGKRNPWRLYLEWFEMEETPTEATNYTGIKKHRTLVAKYADYESIMWCITEAWKDAHNNKGVFVENLKRR